jgi:pimeloyl-ACP methyl ester carboxylesterase
VYINKDIIVAGIPLRVSRIITDTDRPTLVFLHDSLGCIKLWRDFPEQLGNAGGRNVLVYDRQGYGRSSPFGEIKRDNGYLETEAGILDALLTECGIADAVLFGHSDGGSISLIAAAQYPDRIRGVITEGAHIFVEEITLAGIKDAVNAYGNTNLKEKLAKYHGAKTDAVFHAWADTWQTDEYRTWNIEHFLPGIKCPVLVIQGENDEYGSLEQVDRIVEQVSGKAQRLIIPSAGHTPHKEVKETVLEHAVAFINELIAPGR